MSVDRHEPHVLALPEDDANRQLANGFLLDRSVSSRRIRVLPLAGGWKKVLDRFESDHVREMDRYSKRFMVLPIALDGHEDRLTYAKEVVPARLIHRVFVLGVSTEPIGARTIQ